jgi:hypothetical protein
LLSTETFVAISDKFFARTKDLKCNVGMGFYPFAAYVFSPFAYKSCNTWKLWQSPCSAK